MNKGDIRERVCVSGPVLSEEKRDALQELVNLGMGSAGAALATLLGDFVELTVPRIVAVEPSEIQALVEQGPWTSREILAVRQPFFGELMGESVMLFDGLGYGELAQRLGYRQPLSPATEEEIALDLANIVISACVGGIAEPLHEVVSFSRPALMGRSVDLANVISSGIATWSRALLVTIDFRLQSCRFDSWVLVLLSQESIEHIDRALTRFLDQLLAG